jgi:hypothetical protein
MNEQLAEPTATRVCRVCGREQPLDRGHFYWHRQAGIFYASCIVCYCAEQRVRKALRRGHVLPVPPPRARLPPVERQQRRAAAAPRRVALRRQASRGASLSAYAIVPPTASTMTYREAAQWLGISAMTLTRAVQRGLLHPCVVPVEAPQPHRGRPVVLLRQEVEWWREERARRAAAKRQGQ